MSNVKEKVREMADRLPENASWDDVMYEIYVKMKLEAGIRAADEGRVISHEDLKKKYLK